MKMRRATDCFTLCNGVKIPCIGYGVGSVSDLNLGEYMRYAVLCGYRYLDLPEIGNSNFMMDALWDCGVIRADLFLTSHVTMDVQHADRVIAQTEQYLQKHRLDYLDLLLLPWTYCYNQTQEMALHCEAWNAMRRLQKEGKVRAIGVDHFGISQICLLLEEVGGMPMVNRICGLLTAEEHYLTGWCRARGILTEVDRPLNGGVLAHCQEICEIAKRYDATAAQLCIRAILQSGVLPIVHAEKKAYIAEDIRVFDRMLSATDLGRVSAMMAECAACQMQKQNEMESVSESVQVQ